MISLVGILDALYGTGIAILPVIGFVFQYFLIRRRQSIGSFSIQVCGILLLSNILKIGFFIFRPFSIALLFQAMLMIIVQYLLLKLCIDVMHVQGLFNCSQQKSENQGEGPTEFKESFWMWKSFKKYNAAILGLTLVTFSMSYLIAKLELTILGELLGYLAVGVETFLLVPQLIENIKQNRVKGVSYSFVVLNALQDMFQLSFVVIYNQPLQYLILNGIQLLADFALVFQIIYYKFFAKQFVLEELNEVIEPQSGDGSGAKSDLVSDAINTNMEEVENIVHEVSGEKDRQSEKISISTSQTETKEAGEAEQE